MAFVALEPALPHVCCANPTRLQVIDTNLRSVFRLARAAFPLLKAAAPSAGKERPGGKVITVSSLTAQFGSVGMPHYSASKHGLEGLTKSLAVAWGK